MKTVPAGYSFREALSPPAIYLIVGYALVNLHLTSPASLDHRDDERTHLLLRARAMMTPLNLISSVNEWHQPPSARAIGIVFGAELRLQQLFLRSDPRAPRYKDGGRQQYADA